MPPDPFEEQPDRVRTWLVVGSVVSGIGSFVAMIWASMLLAAPSEGKLEIGLPVLVMMLLFLGLLVACIVLGYVAARRRPRT
jgi:hypothetical protein